MAVNFTDDQKKVINAPITNILCSAAAGSGKTAVLVERIINQVTGIGETTPGSLIDIDRILVVTFTKNAAATMKERLAKRLSALCDEYPDNKRVLSQKNKVLYSDILTIDSFCNKIVKSYCYASDIEPGFMIGDSARTSIIRKEAIKDVLFSYYENRDETFLELVKRYASAKDDKIIAEIVEGLIYASESAVSIEDYLGKLADNYKYETAEAFAESKVIKYYMNYANEIFRSVSNTIDNLIAMCEARGEDKLRDLLVEDGDKITDLIGLDYFATRDKLLSTSFKNTSGKVNDEDFKKFIGNMRNSYKSKDGLIGKIQTFFAKFELGTCVETNTELYPLICKLSEVCLKAYREIIRRKKKLNLYDFSDIAHEALRIIKDNESIREEIRSNYDQVMIDEYQDSNFIQEELLTNISGIFNNNPNMFMVGDVKQSIYKFRQAKPELIASKQENFDEADGASDRLIKLNMNFRSARRIIDTVNHTFSKIMSKEGSGIDYHGQELVYGADYKDYDQTDKAVNELILLNTEDKSKDDKNELICSHIANCINSIINDEEFFVYEDGAKRRARYKDIAILTRNKTGIINSLSTYLPDNGIPAMVNTKTGYFTTTEVMLIINYLTIIDNPYKDIEFCSVLKAFPQCVTDEELAMLKIYEREITDGNKLYMYTICEAYVANHDDMLANKLKAFFEDYNKLLSIAKIYGVSDVISAIYDISDYCSYALMMPAGKLRVANLEMLYVKAKAFEETSGSEISAFIQYIDNLKKYEINEGEANVGGGSDFVNIMTIHASKGLEYPVVIIADLDKNFNKSDESGLYVMNDELGLSLQYVDKDVLIKHKTIQNEIIAKCISKENIAEEIRILYVAMTRAMQKLIMIGCVKNREEIASVGVKGEDDRLSVADIVNAKNYMDLILPSFLTTSLANALCEENEQLVGDYLNIKLESEVAKVSGGAEDEKEAAVCDDDYEEIAKYFSYEYPYSHETLPMKYSVSELKHEAIEEYERNHVAAFEADTDSKSAYSEMPKKVPSFIELTEEKVNIGALRGTLVHLFMEHIIKTDLSSVADIMQFAKKKVAEGIFSQDILKYVDFKKIANFLASDTAKQMRAANEKGDLYLEQPFVLGLPAREIDSTKYTSDELIMIQGVIDVFYVMDGQVVLLDYKTDKVGLEDGEERLKALYRRQLQLYARAIEKIKGIKVNSLLIYSFALEKIINL